MKHGEKHPLLTDRYLHQHYVVKGESMVTIARRLRLNVVTINRWLNTFRIPRNRRAKQKLTKGYLQREYVENGQTLRDIAKGTGSSVAFVRSSLVHHGIPLRTLSMAAKLRDARRYAGHVPRKVSQGYVFLKIPSHPRANGFGYVQEHIVVAESILGRQLRKGEVVHHINAVRTDNRPDNLYVFPSHSEHMKHHNHGNARLKSNLTRQNTSCTATIEKVE